MGEVNAPHGTAHVRLVPADTAETWWGRYEATLTGRISDTSREVLAADAEFIVERCVLAADGGGGGRWGESRERSGAVMGAVQSGKTASMLGVIAKAIDAGVDAVVVLGGTRTSLWLQTWERLLEQLDTLPSPGSKRLMLPIGTPGDVAAGQIALGNLYSMTDQLAAKAISRKLPIIAVVLKQVDHLQRVGALLHDVVYPQVHAVGRPFHLLVVDDEADDSSISENDLNSSSSLQEKQVPRRIVDLWESRKLHGQTAIPELRATYLAYTATPQANFLQEQSNPLAPRDFVVCLRTPGADGDPVERGPSYRVPEGLRGWYTGGDVYYDTLSSLPLCLAIDDMSEEERLLHGLRGYLVASAIRLIRAGGAVGPAGVAGQLYETADQAKTASGPVMSMLVHPSAAKDAHFDTAGRLLAWSAGLPPSEGNRLLTDGQRLLRTHGIEADMDESPDLWHDWMAEYAQGLELVREFPGKHAPPLGADWDDLRRIILEEIVPATAVSVINSDERADDRPCFEPVREDDGWRPAPNLSTVFVSGNVMSRGLTLEGLTTTVFTRTSEDPASDTQMQMQRWFGYRGAYIDVCRVLMAGAQIDLFQQYHETDLALRQQILAAMTAESPASPTVLQGQAFKATGKIKNLGGIGLWPGSEPFMRVLNDPTEDAANQELVAALFADPSAYVRVGEGKQGLLLNRPLNLLETADLLDRFCYPTAGGSGVDPAASARWAAVEDIGRIELGSPFRPIFKMPVGTDARAWCAESPFNVAAYLRFWALCLEDRIHATFSTDEPPLLWSLVDLKARADQQPRFRVGLRFGQGALVDSGPLAKVSGGVRPMGREVEDGRLKAAWGSRNYRDGVLWGDEFFDRYDTGQLPALTTSRARERGEDGLLLIHVIARPNGISVAPALSIPVGGPDQVHARVSRSSSGT